MFKVIGLSHLVFSNNCVNLKLSDFLNNNFESPSNFKLDHSISRQPMVRLKENLLSNISLYKSNLKSFPALEVLHVSTKNRRIENSYGIILNSETNSSKGLEKINFCNSNFYANCLFDQNLNSYIAYDTNLIKDKSLNGCWITVNDFHEQVHILSNIFKLEIYEEYEDICSFRCKLLNSTFSNFILVLINGKNKLNQTFNDDLGISTIGWFANTLEIDNDKYNNLQITDEFQIELLKNKFKAKFVYSNFGISHELLKF